MRAKPCRRSWRTMAPPISVSAPATKMVSFGFKRGTQLAEDDGGNFPMGEMLSRDSEDPSTVGARELDWEQFLKT